jgi:hypothetical protein
VSETEEAPPPPDPPPDPPPVAEALSRRRWLGLAVAALIVLTTAFGWGAARYSSVNRQLNDIEAIRRVAGGFGDAALTYDYRNLRPFRDGMNAQATGAFKRQLRDGLGGLEALITELKSTSEATVKDIYVSEVNDHAASAIVVADARVQSGDTAPRTAPGVSIELQLVKVGRRWLIADVSTLDLGRAVSGAAAPGASTTTSQPSK